MNKFSKQVCIVILVCLLVTGILYAKSSVDSTGSEQKVLIEAMIVQISSETIDKFQIGRNIEPSSKVTVPLATLLYVFADPNAVNVIAKSKLRVCAGQMGKVTAGQKLKYLVKRDDGSFEQKTTEKVIGTTFEATPVIDKNGDILAGFKFERITAAPQWQIDPKTSLPIGEPVLGSMGVDNELTKLKSGEPMIVGGSTAPNRQVFFLIRAEILQ